MSVIREARMDTTPASFLAGVLGAMVMMPIAVTMCEH